MRLMGKFQTTGYYISNCTDSFDPESGDCLIARLPWQSVSDFANAEENKELIEKEEFLSLVSNVENFKSKFRKTTTEYQNLGKGVVALYDPEEDIHYFFVNCSIDDPPEIEGE